MTPLLTVENLHTYFYTDTGISRPVEGISFDIHAGQTLALVGESGCGKTVTALSIMRLVPTPGEIVQGKILFQGKDLLALAETQMRSIRGRDIGMIFQEPMTSLNPLYTIGYQIGETILAHQRLPKNQLNHQVLNLLDRVEMPAPEQRYRDYPHNLSGGLRQRAMIAQALALTPSLLIADEPTTALDVTIQAQILQLFTQLKENREMGILLITHDLGIVAEVADKVCIMYAGRIVEEADVFTLFAQPKHPYTEGLLESIAARGTAQKKLCAIPGLVPSPQNKPSGCPFHPRCYEADSHCEQELPPLIEKGPAHSVSCWKAA